MFSFFRDILMTHIQLLVSAMRFHHWSLGCVNGTKKGLIVHLEAGNMLEASVDKYYRKIVNE